MVHIYTIGYMAHDEDNWPAGSKAGTNSYQRFFSYISLFTFSMLMLVMSNNFCSCSSAGRRWAWSPTC
jgi:NADH-quinone oxidoreductase subunit L